MYVMCLVSSIDILFVTIMVCLIVMMNIIRNCNSRLLQNVMNNIKMLFAKLMKTTLLSSDFCSIWIEIFFRQKKKKMPFSLSNVVFVE